MTSFFQSNGFPLHLIQNKIKFFLEAKYNTPVNINSDEIRNFYFSLPYFGYQSEKKWELNYAIYWNNIFRLLNSILFWLITTQ